MAKFKICIAFFHLQQYKDQLLIEIWMKIQF